LENPENSVDNLKGKFNIVIISCGEDAGHANPIPIPPAPPNYSQLSSRATSYETCEYFLVLTFIQDLFMTFWVFFAVPPNYEDIEEDEMHAK
jgi:hypothetical protein